MLKVPFEIGKTYWCPRLHPEQVKVDCPICAGNLTVMVTLGDGSRVVVPCDACGKGFEGPRGYITEYTYEPQAIQFTVKSVQSMHGDNWYLESEYGEQRSWSECFETEEAALEESRKRLAALIEENHRRACYRKKALSKTAWSIRYHREQIKRLEQQLEWHRKHIKPD